MKRRSESEFSFTLVRVAVAQICQSTGFKGSQSPALEALTDVATRYLQAIAKLAAASANFGWRTESNFPDIIVALEDLASVQGFRGFSSIRSPSLYTSAVIKDLIEFVKYTDEIPFAQPLPPMGIYSRKGKFPKLYGLSRGYYSLGRCRHVPRWLPAVPAVEEKLKEVELRKEVKWGCLDGVGESKDGNQGCSERKRVERALDSEKIEVLPGKRGKVRFKMGVAAMGGGCDSVTVGNLRGVGIGKRVWCE
ncbi:transcription initiation factor TFIID subunit 8 [Phtheirospermum japonicum]|uniref:Transcription initiation factor TFIID subunit 8 n=1 Tax=Phtheirospermum japonicum TaxID=374723 RepID=A0A830BGD6_9LAMI|nr:transcription initiation factor TFIID subunit 8 [Phtheirospermum japonicum]